MRTKVFLLGMILMFLPIVFAQVDFTMNPKDILFNFSNMLPGDSVWNTTTLTNTGNMTIYKIIVSTNFANNCTKIEPNQYCNWNGEGRPNLTDVLNCNFIYNGTTILNKTITELKDGAELPLNLKVGESKTLNITVTFYPFAGNKYQATSVVVNFSFTALAPKIKINEIMYNPDDSMQCEDAYCEWIEIYNPTDEEVNLSGWRIYDPSKHEFNILTTPIIEPKSYFILAKNPNNFTQYYPNVGCPIAKVGFSLSNSGETINLTDNFGNLIDSVTYDDRWGANGNGKSLERYDIYSFSDNSSNWNESIPDGGTLGGLNSIVLWISDVSVIKDGYLINVSANITHYFNLLKSEARFVGENGNYTVSLLTIDNQIYNGIWDTSGVENGTYDVFIYAEDIRNNNRTYKHNESVEIQSPPRIITTGSGGRGTDSKKSYLAIFPNGATMRQNETRNFTIEVRNIGNRDIKNFEIFAEDSEVENWINITPNKEKLGVGEVKFWIMTISVPEDAEVGTKSFTINANGDELSLSTNFTLTVVKKPKIFIKEEKSEIQENITGSVPINLTIIINRGDETTDSRNVTLTLSAKNATECRLNNDGINWSDWFSYTTTKEWELSPAPGTKTVYFQCRNEFGNSTIVYDKINYVVPKTTLPTGYVILTNPTVLISIIGVSILAVLSFLRYRKKIRVKKELI